MSLLLNKSQHSEANFNTIWSVRTCSRFSFLASIGYYVSFWTTFRCFRDCWSNLRCMHKYCTVLKKEQSIVHQTKDNESEHFLRGDSFSTCHIQCELSMWCKPSNLLLSEWYLRMQLSSPHERPFNGNYAAGFCSKRGHFSLPHPVWSKHRWAWSQYPGWRSQRRCRRVSIRGSRMHEFCQLWNRL